MNLLVCKCGDCTHWEVERDDSGDTLICKTCSLQIPVKLELEDYNHLLHWKQED